MKKILTLKVKEICSIAKSFLPNFDCPVTSLLLIIGENDEGEHTRLIIPNKEAEFKTDRIAAGEHYRFCTYTQEFFLRDPFDGIEISGHLCLKVMDV